MQTSKDIIMIRPVDFKFNTQTAGNNKFQQQADTQNVQEKALQEFDNFVHILRTEGVEVQVINDTQLPETPDSIFPNNWFSMHEQGQVFLYPMYSENRRMERRNDIIEDLKKHYVLFETHDLSAYEQENKFLEGTGSMVLDRTHKLAYACISDRTHPEVLKQFCALAGYTPVIFNALDQDDFPIYHTNVLMCVGIDYVVICLDAIKNETEREMVIETIEESNKKIIEINFDQMNHFAGNMLQVHNKEGESLLVMSEQAYKSLSKEQVSELEVFNKIITAPLYTIEQNGGGSARCMMAEIHLPAKQESL